jgi:hypothetical protein
MAEAAGVRRPGDPKKAVVAIGIPIWAQEIDEDGNIIEVSPIRAMYDKGAHGVLVPCSCYL